MRARVLPRHCKNTVSCRVGEGAKHRAHAVLAEASSAWASLRSAPPYKSYELKREAERRQTHVFISVPYGHGARSSERARLSASHRGSVPRGLSSPRFCFRPCFLGRSRERPIRTAAPTRGRRSYAVTA